MSSSKKTWEAARKRMAPYLDAVFWQDFGIGDPEKRRSVDWILDRIVRPEFDAITGDESPDLWCVMRMDDNGNEFEVESGLTFEKASAVAHEFKSKGHKQIYWVRRQ